MRRLLPLAAILTCAGLSGCISTAALITAADAVKLDRQPDRYFKLEAKVEGDSTTGDIEFAWKCEHTRVFSAGNMKWGLQWKHTQEEYVVKQLRTGEVLFARVPYGAFCDVAESKAVVLGTAIMANSKADSLTITRGDAKSGRVLRGVVRRTANLWESPPKTSEEAAARGLLEQDLPGFTSAQVSVWTEYEWSKNAVYRERLPSIQNSTRARDWAKLHGKGDNWNAFFLTHQEYLKLPDAKINTSVKPVSGRVVLNSDGTTAMSSSVSFHRSSEVGGPPLDVCVQEDCIRVESGMTSVYFAKARLLVDVYANPFRRAQIP